MTALPIIETQSGDVSAYIPTNVISRQAYFFYTQRSPLGLHTNLDTHTKSGFLVYQLLTRKRA